MLNRQKLLLLCITNMQQKTYRHYVSIYCLPTEAASQHLYKLLQPNSGYEAVLEKLRALLSVGFAVCK